MVEDLSPFFADFAVTATVDGASVSAIFDNGYQASAVGALGMASSMPTLTLPTASVPASPVGKAVVVAGISYTVAEHQPDGSGVSTLVLERA